MASQFNRSKATSDRYPFATNRVEGTARITFRGKVLKDGTQRPDRTYVYSGLDSETLHWADRHVAMANRGEGGISVGRDVIPVLKESATDCAEVVA